jgi:MarR family 2-MHQ and catechol resistance regulon transcriptional repressor
MGGLPALKEDRGSRRLRPSLDDLARGAVIRAGARLFKEADPFYRSLGLTGLQYNVLRVLEEAGEPLPQQEIGRRVFASRANVTSLLDQLEAKGLVARGACADRRVKLVGLTPKALELMERTYAALDAINARLMGVLTDEEKRELLRLAGKLAGTEAAGASRHKRPARA